MKLKFMFVMLLVMFAGMVFAADSLSDYVAQNNDAYKCSMSKIQLSADQAVSVTTVDFTSQVWQNKTFSHTAQIFFPQNALVTDTALMIVAKGKPSDDWSQSVSYFAKSMLAPVVVVYMTPSDSDAAELYNIATAKINAESGKDPIIFADVKTVIKAMDSVGSVTHSEFDRTIDNFVVCGTGYYGMVAYQVATLGDKRIAGIVPMSANINLSANLQRQSKLYGEISSDCKNKGYDIFADTAKNAVADAYLKKFDAYYNIDKITCPKLIVDGTNNPNSVIDSANFYINDFKGETFFWLKTNGGDDLCFTEQTMRINNVAGYSDIISQLNAFFYHITKASVYEKVKFNVDKNSGGVTLTADGNCADVQAAYIYEADSEYSDFRPTFWNKNTLVMKDNTYSYKTSVPSAGCRCIFMELIYTSPLTGTYSVFSAPVILGVD